MSTTHNAQGMELKSALLEGIRKLNNAVSATLGPGGRTVLIKDPNGEVKATKDGVSVAKSFNKLEDELEDLGAQLVKQVSVKSANEAGDGTTTSTLLATEMIEEGIQSILQGNNAVEIKNELDRLVEETVAKIKESSTQISSEDQIKQVATISGNNDIEVGNLIASAIEAVGREGVVTIEESKTGETSLEIVEGMQFDRGYKSPYFATNTSTMQALLEDPYVMLYDGRISTAQELVNVLHKANSENKPLLIVAEDFGDEALATLIVNKMRGIVQVCAVKAPDFGERKTLLLEDMAILTGGQVISKDKGHKLEKLMHQQFSEFLGKCRLVTVSKEETTIVDGKGSEEKIEKRSLEIKEQIEKSTSFYEKEKLQERLGKLVGGVAIISVGGNSDIEIKEKKDRVEDALFATKAALADGIVPGGGTALLHCSKIESNSADKISTVIAKMILTRALEAPFKKILSNSGIKNWWDKIPQEGQVYDAKNHVTVDALEAGIIDPTKVVVTALRNAASVAGTILTSEAAIFEKVEKKNDSQDQLSGMPGMY
jgi:chaperonin GroEL